MRAIDRSTCLHAKCCFQPTEYPCIHELCTQYINVEDFNSLQQLKECNSLLSQAVSAVKQFAPNHNICDRVERWQATAKL